MKQLNTLSAEDLSLLKNLTILYARLSREDINKQNNSAGNRDDSYSIKNQKLLLEQYAKKLELKNTYFLYDDGLSGVFQDTRPGFVKMLQLIEEGKVGAVIVKDLSRLNRNYRDAGELTETIFPHYGIRFIAIGDNVDQRNERQRNRLNGGLDIMVAFKNLMNEGYVQDLSIKLRLSQQTKSSQGFAIGHPPYGYKRSEEDIRLWVVDEEGAKVVRHIFDLRLNHNLSCAKIAEKLRQDKVLSPSVDKEQRGIEKPRRRSYRGDFYWSFAVVDKILKNQSYVGDVVNFKTYTLSYKDRSKIANDPSNWEIHKDRHEPIISRKIWQDVQDSFMRNRAAKPKNIPKHMLAGYLKCATCGGNLNYKHIKDAPQNDYFSCGNNRRGTDSCKQTHHIRVDAITCLVTSQLDNIVRFASAFEDDFVKLVIDEQYKTIKLMQIKNKRELVEFRARERELDTLCEKLYEDKVLGTLSEERYKKLSLKYETEQIQLLPKIKSLQKIVSEEEKHELDINSFLAIVRQYTRVNELTPELIRTFVDKIVVHHREELKNAQHQKVEIYFKMLGTVTLPNVDEQKKYKKSFARKKENQTALAI